MKLSAVWVQFYGSDETIKQLRCFALQFISRMDVHIISRAFPGMTQLLRNWSDWKIVVDHYGSGCVTKTVKTDLGESSR